MQVIVLPLEPFVKERERVGVNRPFGLAVSGQSFVAVEEAVSKLRIGVADLEPHRVRFRGGEYRLIIPVGIVHGERGCRKALQTSGSLAGVQ